MPRLKKKPKLDLPPHVVLKKDGEWHVRVFFPTRLKDKKGRRVYEQASRKCEIQTAEHAADIVRMLKQQHVTPAAVTNASRVGDFLGEFLQLKAGTVAARTQEYYEHLFNFHIKDSAFADLPMSALSTLEVQHFYGSLMTTGRSATMVRKINTFLSMAFLQAHRWGHIDKNPCDGVLLPKVKREESIALSEAEAKKLMTIAGKDDRFIMFEVALETGLRPQEVVGLAWKHIDLKRKKLRVEQAVIEGFSAGPPAIGDVKTPNSIRTLGLSDYLVGRLKRQREIIDDMIAEAKADSQARILLKHKKATGVNYARRKTKKTLALETLATFAKYDLVFPAHHGGPKSLRNVNRREFADLLEKAGLDRERVSFKTLRHTCLTLLADHLHPKKLQKHAGHAELSTTMKYYVHVDEDAQFEASGKMDRLLRAA